MAAIADWPYTIAKGDPSDYLYDLYQAIKARFTEVFISTGTTWTDDPGAPGAGQWLNWVIYRNAIEYMVNAGGFANTADNSIWTWADVCTEAFGEADWRTGVTQRCGHEWDITDMKAVLDLLTKINVGTNSRHPWDHNGDDYWTYRYYILAPAGDTWQDTWTELHGAEIVDPNYTHTLTFSEAEGLMESTVNQYQPNPPVSKQSHITTQVLDIGDRSADNMVVIFDGLRAIVGAGSGNFSIVLEGEDEQPEPDFADPGVMVHLWTSDAAGAGTISYEVDEDGYEPWRLYRYLRVSHLQWWDNNTPLGANTGWERLYINYPDGMKATRVCYNTTFDPF